VGGEKVGPIAGLSKYPNGKLWDLSAGFISLINGNKKDRGISGAALFFEN